MKVTKETARKVLALLRSQHGCKADDPCVPTLVEKWNWFDMADRYVADYSIVWEEGPHNWTYHFPHGGVMEEFGHRAEDVSDELDALGVLVEPATGWASHIWPNVGQYDMNLDTDAKGTS
jgi:hypothetical protein